MDEAADVAEAAEMAAAADVPAPPQQQAWADVVTAGMSLLGKLGQALSADKAEKPGTPAAGGLPGGLVTQDEQTGQPYLKLPLPEPETVQVLPSKVSPRELSISSAK